MKRKVLLITIVACFSTLAVGRYAYAQPPWAMGGGPPGMMPGMWGGPQMPQPVQASITGNPEIDRRVQFYEGLMRQMDTNQDGTVSKEEISQARMGEYLVSRMKERAGVDVSGGFRIDELRQKVIDYYKQRYGGDSQSGQSSSGSQSSTTSAQSQQTVSILRLGPNVTVPGFGTPTTSSPTTPTVPGFGSPMTGSATPGTVSGTAPSTSSGSPSPGQVLSLPPPQPLDERIRRYAEGLMRQYDENRSGELEKNEWEKMRGSDWAKADKDGNSELTLQEIAEHLAAQAGMSSSSSSSAKATPVSTKRFIQRSPWDRLPEGLPSWFKEKDRDRDGQILMAEFSDKWTQDKLREFQKYDLNGDGVITPGECLKAGKGH